MQSADRLEALLFKNHESVSINQFDQEDRSHARKASQGYLRRYANSKFESFVEKLFTREKSKEIKTELESMETMLLTILSKESPRIYSDFIE